MFEKVYRRNPDIVYREIAGEFILVPIHHKAGETDSIYVLNETGTRIWELVDGKRTLADIVDMFTAEFDVDDKTVADDLLLYRTVDDRTAVHRVSDVSRISSHAELTLSSDCNPEDLY